MDGYWALWHVPSRNLLEDFESKSEALDLVLALVGQGWKPEELVLILDDPAVADEDLPLGVTGEELARRAGLTGADSARPTI